MNVPLFFVSFQVIPVISSLTPVTTAVPLIGVLSLTALKDAYDDIVSFLRGRGVANGPFKFAQLITVNVQVKVAFKSPKEPFMNVTAGLKEERGH